MENEVGDSYGQNSAQTVPIVNSRTRALIPAQKQFQDRYEPIRPTVGLQSTMEEGKEIKEDKSCGFHVFSAPIKIFEEWRSPKPTT